MQLAAVHVEPLGQRVELPPQAVEGLEGGGGGPQLAGEHLQQCVGESAGGTHVLARTTGHAHSRDTWGHARRSVRSRRGLAVGATVRRQILCRPLPYRLERGILSHAASPFPLATRPYPATLARVRRTRPAPPSRTPSTIPPESRIQRGFSPVGGAVSGGPGLRLHQEDAHVLQLGEQLLGAQLLPRRAPCRHP